MPATPSPAGSQYVFGPSANDGDMLQFKNETGIVSWIDLNGYAWGNLGSISYAAANFADAEIPSGSGTNFTLAHSPNPAASLMLFWNGILLQSGVDFTLAGNALTMTQTVEASDQFVCWYRYV